MTVTDPGLDSIVTLWTLELCQLFKLLGIIIIIQEPHMVGRVSWVWMMVNPCQNVSFSDKWLFDWKKKLLSQSTVFRILYMLIIFSLLLRPYTANKAGLTVWLVTNVSQFIGSTTILHTDRAKQPLTTLITLTDTHTDTHTSLKCKISSTL